MNKHTEAVLDYTCIKRVLQAFTVTPMGEALASDLTPSADLALVDAQLRETSEMVACLDAGAAPPVLSLADLRPQRLDMGDCFARHSFSWRLPAAWRLSNGFDIILKPLPTPFLSYVAV